MPLYYCNVSSIFSVEIFLTNINNNMKFIELFILLIIVYILFVYWNKSPGEVTYTKSNLDNREYLVRNLDDKQQAADNLAYMRQNLIKLVAYLNKKYPTDKNIARLIRRFNPDVISEGSSDAKYTSYTLNKGEKVVFCLRSRNQTDVLHDRNTLMFVSIHEMGHIMSKSKNHTDEFKDNFAFLLENAVELGIYSPQNFNRNPQEYCGISITDTPLNNSHFK